jgi:DNA-binding transcriptional regulator YdaS (Cro superfamily)
LFLTNGTNRSNLRAMKLADYLANKKLDESAFAMSLGMSPKAVRHWVRGVRIPRSGPMQKIIAATNGAVTPNDFLPSRTEAAE